jgi:hypothetical protein
MVQYLKQRGFLFGALGWGQDRVLLSDRHQKQRIPLIGITKANYKATKNRTF